MRVIGTIIQIQGRGTFGSAGGVTVQLEKGAVQYHPFSRLRPGSPSPHVGAQVEVLDRGQSWTVLLTQDATATSIPADLHPDSHPEPPPALPRVPRTAQRPTERMPEPTVLDLILAEQKRTNELLQKLINQSVTR